MSEHEWKELPISMAPIEGTIQGRPFSIPGDKFYHCSMCGLVALSGGRYFPSGKCSYSIPRERKNP